MERKKCDYFKSGEYICIADEWININASYMFDNLCWHIYTKNTKFLDLGFHKEEDDYLGLYLPYGDNYNYSAYRKSCFCNYKGYKCQCLELTEDRTIILDPSIEYQTMSGDHAMHGYDPCLRVKEVELDSIWEERVPIKGFKFDVEPIIYLKKDGVWLVGSEETTL